MESSKENIHLYQGLKGQNLTKCRVFSDSTSIIILHAHLIIQQGTKCIELAKFNNVENIFVHFIYQYSMLNVVEWNVASVVSGLY